MSKHFCAWVLAFGGPCRLTTSMAVTLTFGTFSAVLVILSAISLVSSTIILGGTGTSEDPYVIN